MSASRSGQSEQEIEHDLVEAFWLLHLRQVGGLRNDGQPGAGDGGGQGRGGIAHVLHISVAVDDEGGRGDGRQPLGSGRIERDCFSPGVIAQEEGAVHLPHELAHLPIDNVRAALRAIDPHAQLVFHGPGDMKTIIAPELKKLDGKSSSADEVEVIEISADASRPYLPGCYSFS